MRRHRKFALWMGVIMAVSAVTSEVPDDICEVVKAAENTVSMTDFASSGEAAGTITISTGEELTLCRVCECWKQHEGGEASA